MTKQIISMSMARQMKRPFAGPMLREQRGKWSMEEREWLAMNYDVVPDAEYAAYIERQRRAARSGLEKAVEAVKERIADVVGGPAAAPVAPKKQRPQAPAAAPTVDPRKRTFFT
ncbi:hypothetical protein WKW79_17405 [Variovorax robiniae]|uniref:Uncharacterized protein n=1 Tax=Variovorax robiniae TaxID=1836199 RepID=A0ABU8X965_9BURK